MSEIVYSMKQVELPHKKFHLLKKIFPFLIEMTFEYGGENIGLMGWTFECCKGLMEKSFEFVEGNIFSFNRISLVEDSERHQFKGPPLLSAMFPARFLAQSSKSILYSRLTMIINLTQQLKMNLQTAANTYEPSRT